MGKIIPFNRLNIKNEPEGIQLYYKIYKECNGRTAESILNQIARDMGCNSCYDRNFLHNITPQDSLELIGYAAAKKIIKTAKATADYYRKLSAIMDEYGLEVIWNVKTN